ncbi:heterokaryon incompatibility protein-domain-containing protein [Stachybotrys elegans]|uniref:Heterokaryon incompatibility protein-domain-containing protein n=1 Tax=Stachybotrys elegans TaxID=80388 RepID=A0A8K0SCR3_9HYPO|nr:heterokaryon incompatibility protein-domain-containing protein [Stachybotrys elegans]
MATFKSSMSAGTCDGSRDPNRRAENIHDCCSSGIEESQQKINAHVEDVTMNPEWGKMCRGTATAAGMIQESGRGDTIGKDETVLEKLQQLMVDQNEASGVSTAKPPIDYKDIPKPTIPVSQCDTRNNWNDIIASIKDGILPLIKPPTGSKERVRQSLSYSPLLSATHIRLLKLALLQDVDDVFEPFHCSMVVADLDQHTQYHALSYTWGEPISVYEDAHVPTPEDWEAPAFDIHCNGEVVSVATNLYTALISIRWLLSQQAVADVLDASNLYLWVDAICINQQDVKERNSQVLLIDRLYASAQCTFMWLGGEDTFSMQAEWFFLLTRLPGRAEIPVRIDIHDNDFYARVGLEQLGPEARIGLFGFYSRQYFSRAWIIQEWVRSRDTMAICGFRLLDPQDLAGRLGYLHGMDVWPQVMNLFESRPVGQEQAEAPFTGMGERIIFTRGNMQLPMPILQCILALKTHLSNLSLFHRLNLGLEGLDLYGNVVREPLGRKEDAFYTLQSFRHAKASDPRDKGFAFLGILDEFRSKSNSSLTLRPDYTRPTLEVYVEVAKQMISGGMGLRWLALKEARATIDGLPSWAPDLSTTYGTLLLGPVPFTESSGLVSSSVEFLENNILSASGYKADTVVATFHLEELTNTRKLEAFLSHIPLLSEIKQPRFSGTVRPWWRMYADNRQEAQALEPVTTQGRFEVLWRALLLDHDNSTCSYPADPSHGAALPILLEYYILADLLSTIINDIGDRLGIPSRAAEALRRKHGVRNRNTAVSRYVEKCTALFRLRGHRGMTWNMILMPRGENYAPDGEYTVVHGSFLEYEKEFQQVLRARGVDDTNAWDRCAKAANAYSNPRLSKPQPSSQGLVSSVYLDIEDASDVQAVFVHAQKHDVVCLSGTAAMTTLRGAVARARYRFGIEVLREYGLSKTLFSRAVAMRLRQCQIYFGAASTPARQLHCLRAQCLLPRRKRRDKQSVWWWLLNGSHNVLPGRGLSVDTVLEITIVTPNGQVRVANQCPNPNLLWALWGGGTGAFGTRVTLLQFTPTANNQERIVEILAKTMPNWTMETSKTSLSNMLVDEADA